MPRIPRPRLPDPRVLEPARLVATWAESAQQRACHNAMVASTALAQRRAERDEVEQYLADLTGPHAAPVRSVTNSAG